MAFSFACEVRASEGAFVLQMSDWHVSESDSENEKRNEKIPYRRQELLGFKLDPDKLPELLLAVQRGSSLDLECTSHCARRRKARKKHARRRKPKYGCIDYSFITQKYKQS